MLKINKAVLPDKTPYIKATYYEEGMRLTGEWEVSLKIDGIRYIRNKDRVPCTRQGTPALTHIGMSMPSTMDDAELFRDDWSTSMSLKAGTIDASCHDWYSLHPTDQRLVTHACTGVNHAFIINMLKWALSQGHEGIVLKQNAIWIKVVPTRTVDVMVTGWYEGNGRLKGSLGGLTTKYGRVGGGFTDEQRKQLWSICQTDPKRIVGKLIEAEYREKTTGNKMRMARFKRFRLDKTEESWDLPYRIEDVYV